MIASSPEIDRLAGAKDDWAAQSPRQRVEILDDLLRSVSETASEWASACARAKGVAGTPLEGEEWIAGPWAVLYAINRYRRTLGEIVRFGHARPSSLRVFPHDLYDRFLLAGVSAEVRLQPSVSLDASLAGQTHRGRGRIALVLAAGNVSSIPALDVLHELLARDAVCLLKLNPVNEYIGPILQKAFAPLIERGYLQLVYGDAEAGSELCRLELVDEIHVTGSLRTFESIRSIVPDKPITAELGNVSPTIVLPGRWSDRELRFQAEHIATQKAHNAGFNCISAQVLVLPAGWKQKQHLLDATAEVLHSFVRPEYYPGAASRRERFAGGGSAQFPILFLDPNDEQAFFTEEAFCGVLGVVELPGERGEYLQRAVRFANDRLQGTLGANLIVDPRTERAMKNELARALDELAYGCIGINAWTGLGYFLTETPWGAYPRDGISASGTGAVHNSYFLTNTEKTIVRAPFAPRLRPPWFVTNGKQAVIARRLCEFEAKRSPLTALRVALAALGDGVLH